LPTYALHLMGTPRLLHDGAEVHIGRRKVMGLLAYLAVTHRPHARDALAAMLWPEADPASARAALRRRLSQINKLLGGGAIAADRWSVGLSPDLGLWLDVTAFRDLLARTQKHRHPSTEACPECVPLLGDAVALYTDGFMAGFTLGDSAAFDEWQRFQTEAIRDEAASALVRLAAYTASQGDFDRALEYARRWLAFDPLHEPAHRHLIVLYARSNQRAAALRQFEACRRVLKEELDVEPSQRTRDVYDRLLSDRMPLALTPVEAILERELRTVGPCPYRGLAAFREADAPFFHGRESFCERLTSAVSTQPLVAMIVGASGSGKSSVIYAGLIPRLRESGGWAVADLRPGREPFHALANALVTHLDPALGEASRLVQTRTLAHALSEGEVPLIDAVIRIHQRQSGSSRFLLLVDQFEELYTLCPDPDMRRSFIDTLLAAVDAATQTADFTLLITLRADFMGQALAHRPMADALQAASQLLGPMTRDELRDAIEKPAKAQSAAFEAGLVERLLEDVADEPGHLPLLEFALTLLWERLDFGWLTHAAYEQIGRVEGALARYAQQVFNELPADDQLGARRVFTQLVQPGEGTEDTRRVATRAEVGQDGWQLVQHLANQRLVVTGRDELTGTETVEVVHEALIANWGQLQAWMNEDRAFRTWQERLRVALSTWEDSGRDQGAMLRGTPLAEAQGWLEERPNELTQIEATYIGESAANRDRRRRTTIVVLLGGLALAFALVGLTLYQRARAVQERQASQRQAAVLLAGQAETELANGYHDRAVLLALSALERYPHTPQAEHALARSVSYNRALQQYAGHTGAATSAAWSPDGSRVATSAGVENRVDVWNPATGERLLAIELPTGITGNLEDMALHVQWTPDGTQLLTLAGDRYRLGSQDYDLLAWDAASGRMLSTTEIANRTVSESGGGTTSFIRYVTGGAADIGPLSERLATVAGDNTAAVWGSDWQEPMVVLRGHTRSVNSVDWAPDESRLVTAALDGTARVWDAVTGQELTLLSGHEGRVHTAVWSPDGAYIATGGDDGSVRIWAAADGSAVAVLEANAGVVTSLAWAPEGWRIVSGHDDGALRIWEMPAATLLETLRGHNGMVTDIAWSPVDDRFVSTDSNGGVRVWNADPSTAWRLFPPQAEQGGTWWVQGVRWFQDSNRLMLAGGDPVGFTEPPLLSVWHLNDDRLDAVDLSGLPGHYPVYIDLSPDETRVAVSANLGYPEFEGATTSHVLDIGTGLIARSYTPEGGALIPQPVWSPDGAQLSATMWNGEISIWDYASGQEVVRLVHSQEGESASTSYWSPDGTRLLSAGDDSVAVVWDTATWQRLYELHHNPPTFVSTAMWSPDGTRILTTAGNDEQGASDTSVRIWDASDGTELLVIDDQPKAVWLGSWSPDGTRVAAWVDDGTVRVWDAATGDRLLTLDVPVFYGGTARWSPDGQYLATAGPESLGAVWRVWQSPEELLEYAKECCVFRELTSAERAQFGLTE